jgi:hypothetical protein
MVIQRYGLSPLKSEFQEIIVEFSATQKSKTERQTVDGINCSMRQNLGSDREEIGEDCIRQSVREAVHGDHARSETNAGEGDSSTGGLSRSGISHGAKKNCK